MNLMFLVPGEVGGSEPLLTNLSLAVAKAGHEVTVFGVAGFRRAYPSIDAAAHVVEMPWSKGAQALRIATEHTWLMAEAKRRKLDVVHHGVGTTPFIRWTPTVVTLHDIQYRHYPDNFVKIKRVWLGINVPHSIRHSITCVPSEYVRRDVISSFGPDLAEHIKVVPFGGQNLFMEGTEDPETIRERYRLDRPFLLYPARTYPHKNHHFLFQAFSPLADEADLVLTGAPWFLDRDLLATERRLGLTGKIRHLGQVPRRDLGGLYRGALGLVYPTRFEGFGAPVLEAMSLGCPVIAADVTAVPEVVGESGILLSPDDLEGWTDSMSKLLGNSNLREDLTRRGLLRASQFSWERSAELQVDAYNLALESG